MSILSMSPNPAKLGSSFSGNHQVGAGKKIEGAGRPSQLRQLAALWAPNGSIFLAQQFHDIAPPVDYSLVPAWVIFVGTFLALTIAGAIAWLIVQSRKKLVPIKSPRQRALELLDRIQDEIEMLSPYQFSIRVSDILRSYVTEQYNLPVTRQTSIEFLNIIKTASPFSDDEKELLKDFLDRCDLIKFARYEATTPDSHLLLEEATRFVKGGQLATV